MRAGVSSACSSRRARYSGVGRHSLYASRTGSGIAISGSIETSWPISPIGKIGVRSSGPAGSPVRGLSGGSGSPRGAGGRVTPGGGGAASARGGFGVWGGIGAALIQGGGGGGG